MKMVKQSEFRLIKRLSTSGNIYVAEDTNANFAVVQGGEVVGTFEHQADAYRLFGTLTRAEKGE